MGLCQQIQGLLKDRLLPLSAFLCTALSVDVTVEIYTQPEPVLKHWKYFINRPVY